jgi:hypothetical protein
LTASWIRGDDSQRPNAEQCLALYDATAKLSRSVRTFRDKDQIDLLALSQGLGLTFS